MRNNKIIYAVCCECGKRWNISIFHRIPKDGYVCPHCISKMRRQRALTKWLLITLAGIALYKWGVDAAYIERGYKAYGGECFLLLLPIWWYLVENVIKDLGIKNRKKALFTDSE